MSSTTAKHKISLNPQKLTNGVLWNTNKCNRQMHCKQRQNDPLRN